MILLVCVAVVVNATGCSTKQTFDETSSNSLIPVNNDMEDADANETNDITVP